MSLAICEFIEKSWINLRLIKLKTLISDGTLNSSIETYISKGKDEQNNTR